MEEYEGAQKHVYMVDTHANYPQVPHRSFPPKPLPPLPPPPRSHGARSCQMVMALLMFLLFCFTAAQAVFLYRLYHPTATADSPTASKITHDRIRDSPDISMTSKPLAHLTVDGFNVNHDRLSWSTDGDSFLRQMRYKDGQLIVKVDGFYFVYSKLFFLDSAQFDHSVRLKSRTYQQGSIVLLKARTIPRHHGPPAKTNSYLGGVFQLRKGDVIFVQVNKTAQIIQASAAENFFGAFMI